MGIQDQKSLAQSRRAIREYLSPHTQPANQHTSAARPDHPLRQPRDLPQPLHGRLVVVGEKTDLSEKFPEIYSGLKARHLAWLRLFAE